MTVAVVFSFQHFYHMDKANAAIHCADVRFSPITFRLAEAIASSDQTRISKNVYDMMKEVLEHKGQYEEDKGR